MVSMYDIDNTTASAVVALASALACGTVPLLWGSGTSLYEQVGSHVLWQNSPLPMKLLALSSFLGALGTFTVFNRAFMINTLKSAVKVHDRRVWIQSSVAAAPYAYVVFLATRALISPTLAQGLFGKIAGWGGVVAFTAMALIIHAAHRVANSGVPLAEREHESSPKTALARSVHLGVGGITGAMVLPMGYDLVAFLMRQLSPIVPSAFAGPLSTWIVAGIATYAISHATIVDYQKQLDDLPKTLQRFGVAFKQVGGPSLYIKAALCAFGALGCGMYMTGYAAETSKPVAFATYSMIVAVVFSQLIGYSTPKLDQGPHASARKKV